MPGIDCKRTTCRERQFSPKKCAKGSFRTKKIGRKANIVVCCPKGKWDRKKELCRVGTRAQSIVRPLGSPKCRKVCKLK